MKKIIIIIILFLFITGCGTKETQENKIEEYYLTYEGNDIKLNTLYMNNFVIIGDYNQVREEQSSYYDGKANIYSYDDFEIETYYDNHDEKISNITITNEEIKTNEGIKIGDSKKEMLETYGKNYKNPIDNTFNYNLGKTNISFILENDIIISIEYFLS